MAGAISRLPSGHWQRKMLKACPTMSVALVFAIAALTAASGFFVVAPSFYTNSRLTRGLRQYPPDSSGIGSSAIPDTARQATLSIPCLSNEHTLQQGIIMHLFCSSMNCL